MLNVSTIKLIKEEKAYAWNVVFTLNDHKIKYATDVVYAVKRNYWLANPFITHELSSLIEGDVCPQCNRDKIACLTLCGQHVEVTAEIIKHPRFRQLIVENVQSLTLNNFPSELKIELGKEVWDNIIYENTTEKIKLRQN